MAQSGYLPGPEIPALGVSGQGAGWIMPAERRWIAVLIQIVLFILSALGLVAAGKEFLRRGRNLGLWGA